MCISFYCIEPNNSDYKLILSFNRDEFLARPTASAKWQKNLLGGWDLQPGREGGTWLALDKSGRIAFLTNIYGVMDPAAVGRGRLVVDWLEGKVPAKQYLEQIKESNTNYNPFNLVLFEPSAGIFKGKGVSQSGSGGYNVWQYTRGKPGHTDSFGPECVSLGVHGISNHPHRQEYHKTEWGRRRMEEIMKKCLFKKENELVEEIEEMMGNSESHWPDPQIQKQADSKSRVYPFRNKLASVFVEKIDGLDYGTMTTTTVLVNIDNKVAFREKTWGEGEAKIMEENFEIDKS